MKKHKHVGENRIPQMGMKDENQEQESATIISETLDGITDNMQSKQIKAEKMTDNIQSKRFKFDDKLVDVGAQLLQSSSIDKQALVKLLYKQKEEYNYKLELGKQIFEILQEGEIRPNHLTSEQMEAFELYRLKMSVE